MPLENSADPTDLSSIHDKPSAVARIEELMQIWNVKQENKERYLGLFLERFDGELASRESDDSGLESDMDKSSCLKQTGEESSDSDWIEEQEDYFKAFSAAAQEDRLQTAFEVAFIPLKDEISRLEMDRASMCLREINEAMRRAFICYYEFIRPRSPSSEDQEEQEDQEVCHSLPTEPYSSSVDTGTYFFKSPRHENVRFVPIPDIETEKKLNEEKLNNAASKIKSRYSEESQASGYNESKDDTSQDDENEVMKIYCELHTKLMRLGEQMGIERTELTGAYIAHQRLKSSAGSESPVSEYRNRFTRFMLHLNKPEYPLLRLYNNQQYQRSHSEPAWPSKPSKPLRPLTLEPSTPSTWTLSPRK